MTRNFRLILEEAAELGLRTSIISQQKEVAEISDGAKSVFVLEAFSLVDKPDSESIRLAKNKEVTYALWERAGIPFPRGRFFKNYAAFAEESSSLQLRLPVVLKQSNGKKSQNIHTNISSYDELAQIASTFEGSFIVQEMAFGKEYRLLIYAGKLIGGLEMIPPQVIGDGRSSILSLIEKKNSALKKKVLLNEKVSRTLERNNLSLDSIPADGSVVLLQENSCLAEGGSTADCTDIVHERIKALARAATSAVNLQLGGIDIICEDISKDPADQKVSFLEINSLPSLDIHYAPTIGAPRRVVEDILKGIFVK